MESYPQAPNFVCQAYYNSAIIPFQLSMPLKFSRGVVLFFYERDFMKQTSMDINQIEDNLGYFVDAQVFPIAVSVDSINNHKAFVDKYSVYGILHPVSFPLLADTTRLISQCMGVMNDKSGSSERSAFIIDKEGRVMYKFKPRSADKVVPYPMNLIFLKLGLLA
ncbi:thioredoxin-like protein [Phycomyces nitens]|nr:thioredoxin-like protein [Phycomyces nitens]